MIAHGKDIKIFSGTSNRPLAEAICKEVGTELGNAEVGAFSDGENFVSIYETVRGSDVFVVQSTSSPVNDNLMELLIMIDALKRASAGRIMMSSSMRLSLTGELVDWTTNTSEPRTVS